MWHWFQRSREPEALVIDDDDTTFLDENRDTAGNQEVEDTPMRQYGQDESDLVQPLVPPNLIRRLTTHVIRAWKSVVESEKNQRILSWFYAAYEYRAQFPWLFESAKQGEGGLQVAIRDALEMYDVRDMTIFERNKHDMQIKIPQRTVILTPEHLTRLGQAFFEVVQDEEIMEGFAYALTWGGINIETVTSEDIQRHLLNALSQYAQEQEVGLSADPL